MAARTVVVAVVLAALILAAAEPADAGIRFRYSSSDFRIYANFGYPWLTYYLPGHAYYPGPVHHHYYRPYHAVLPITSLGNLPYIPPGTIYSVDPGAYRTYRSYRYPYGRYGYGLRPGYGFYHAYLYSASAASRHVVVQSAAATPAPVVNETKVIVNITPQAAGTQVTVAGDSWKRDLWRVPVSVTTATGASGAPPPTVPATSEDIRRVKVRPTARQPVRADTQEGLLALLVRGDDSQRETAAKELKRFNTLGVINALADALLNDGEDDVREEAAGSLGAMLAWKARSALWQAARQDTDRNVRNAAREAALKIEAYYKVED